LLVKQKILQDGQGHRAIRHPGRGPGCYGYTAQEGLSKARYSGEFNISSYLSVQQSSSGQLLTLVAGWSQYHPDKNKEPDAEFKFKEIG
jgi:hypothetical protein